MQVSTGTPPDSVSSEELSRIADEVGIDPRYLDQAIEELDKIDLDAGQTRWLGAPPAYEIDRFIEGQLSEEAWLRMVGELNSDFQQGIPGTFTPSVCTWHHKHDLGAITVTATRGPTSTRLKIATYIDDGLAVGMIFAVFLMLLACVPSMEADDLPLLIRILIPLIAVPGIWMGFRRTVKSWYGKDRIKMNKLANRLHRLAESNVVSADSIEARRVEEQPVQLIERI